MNSLQSLQVPLAFAHKFIIPDCVFWSTPLVYGTVNLKPIVPGRMSTARLLCHYQATT
jgi:hypothetical protein